MTEKIVERLNLTLPLDPFMGLKALAAYSGLSVRTLRGYIDKLPDEALPVYRLGKKLLVRRSEFDAWIAQYRSRGRPSLAAAIKALGLNSVGRQN